MHSNEGAKSVCIIITVAGVSKQNIVRRLLGDTLYNKFVYFMETQERIQ